MSFFQISLLSATSVLASLKYVDVEPFRDQHLATLVLWSLLASTTLNTIYRLVVHPFLLDPLRHLPGPKGGIPFIGYASEGAKRPPSLQWSTWISSIPNEGLLRIPWLFGTNAIVPTSAQTLSQVLVTKSYDFEKDSAVRRMLHYVLGDGLITIEGDVHRVHRKNMGPMFGHRQIKNMHPLIWEKVVKMVNNITAATPGNEVGKTVEVDVYAWASRATLDIIGIVALGHEFNSLDNAGDQLAQLYEWFFTPNIQRSVWFAMTLMFPEVVMKFLPWRFEDVIKKKSKELHRRCEELVEHKKDYMEKYDKDRVDVLENMIQAGFFSNRELVGELLSMLAAGHETTSSSLTWTLYALAKDRQLQTRLRAEVVEAIDNYSAQEDLASGDFSNILDTLPLLHGVCNESQRLWPAVPGTQRVATNHTTIGDQPIPKGTRFVLPIWNINRLPSFWGPDAAAFKPERWINEDNGKPNNHGGCSANFGFMTYLHGPRSCIGQGLARAELKALVAAWLYCFEFELEDPNFEAEAAGIVTVKPKNGLKLRMKVLRSL